MPTISLRLTDTEHEALKAWAHDSRRSIQKEAVYRLFANRLETDVPEAIVGAIVPGLEVRRAAPPPSDHFKPRVTHSEPPKPDPNLVSVVTRDRGSHHPERSDEVKSDFVDKKRK